MLYNDLNGEWFGIDDLVVAAVSFTIGYLTHGFSTGNWGWDAVKSGFMMAAMGWISYNTAGLSTVFSGSGFWAAVGNGAVSGALSGGINAVMTGESILQGIATGAVMGGVMGAVSYGVNKFCNNTTTTNNYNVTTENDVMSPLNSSADNLKYSNETIEKFEKAYCNLNNFGVENVYLEVPEGFSVAKNGKFYKSNFFDRIGINGQREIGDVLGVTVKGDIYLSKPAFNSKSLFTEVITHETGHVIFYKSPLLELAQTLTNFKKFGDALDNWGM